MTKKTVGACGNSGGNFNLDLLNSRMKPASHTVRGPDSFSSGRREAFTVVELIVVIVLVGTVAGIILSFVSQSRARAHRAQCLDNLRRVGSAMIEYAETNGRFPASGLFSYEDLPSIRYRNWVVDLLPHLGRGDLHEAWNFDEPYDDTSRSDNGNIAQTHVDLLACPADDSLSGQGDLSYVVNGGFAWSILERDCLVTAHSDGETAWVGRPQPFDFNGNGRVCSDDSQDAESETTDKELYHRLGLFFVANWPPGTGVPDTFHTLESVTDGLSHTIMFSENVCVGFADTVPLKTLPAGRESNWATPDILWQSFLVSGYVCEDLRCADGRVDYRRANNRSQAPYSYEAINASLHQSEGGAPWPSSHHPGGGVNFVLCGGEARFLSEEVDGAVYAALVSPQGETIRGPLAQISVSEAILSEVTETAGF